MTARSLGRGLAALLLLVPTVALAAVVKGKTAGGEKLLNPVWNEAKDPAANRYTWREPSPTVRAEFRVLFAHQPKEVCIAAIGDAAITPGTAPIAFKIAGGRSNPVELVVTPGAVIEFQNRDPFPHRPFIVGEGSFQAADMKTGSLRQWKVPKEGKYEIRDELFPSVRSWITAEPNVVAITYPQRDGSFSFANLAPGKYTLQPFFSGAKVGTPQDLEVKADVELKDPLRLAEPDKKDPPAAPKGKGK